MPAHGVSGPEVVLNFHGLGPVPDRVGAEETWYWCDTDMFRRQLDAVGRMPPGTTVVLTFDDGNRSDLDIAAPELAQRGLAGTFFVCTGRLGDAAYLSAADLASLEALGMTVGCHGRDHLRLREVSDIRLKEETSGARRELEAVLGHIVADYALPFGNYDRRVIAALDGFARIHTTDAWSGRTDDRIVDRYTYTRAWDEHALDRFGAERRQPLRRIRMRARLWAKRHRAGLRGVTAPDPHTTVPGRT